MYKSLLEYATDARASQTSACSEKELIEALIEEGSQRKAALKIGVSASTIERCLDKLRVRARTPSEVIGKFDEPIKSQLSIKGTSTYYDLESGEALRSWVKLDKNKEQLESDMKEAIEAMK